MFILSLLALRICIRYGCKGTDLTPSHRVQVLAAAGTDRRYGGVSTAKTICHRLGDATRRRGRVPTALKLEPSV